MLPQSKQDAGQTSRTKDPLDSAGLIVDKSKLQSLFAEVKITSQFNLEANAQPMGSVQSFKPVTGS